MGLSLNCRVDDADVEGGNRKSVTSAFFVILFLLRFLFLLAFHYLISEDSISCVRYDTILLGVGDKKGDVGFLELDWRTVLGTRLDIATGLGFGGHRGFLFALLTNATKVGHVERCSMYF